MGELAFTGGRVSAQFRDRHLPAERAMRRAAQPHAVGPSAGELAAVARGGGGRTGTAQGAARPLSDRRDGVLADQPVRRQRQEQRSVAD
jgi:hypothetical protein